MTPSDTNPCVCGHSPHQHTTQNSQPICLICTTKTGDGCRGYITDRTPESTTRDAFLAGFDAGARWERTGRIGSAAAAVVEQYEQWAEGSETT